MRAKTLQTYSFVVMILIILLIVTVPALKVTVKNSKMVLKMEPGEKITKSIGIVNDNDVVVNASLTVFGDLEKNIKLEKANYTLQPQEEIQAKFTLTAPKKEGTNETKILVQFSSGEESPIGFASNIVVITTKDANEKEVEETEETEEVEDQSNTNPITGNVIGSSMKLNPLYILLISTLVLAIILIALIIYALNKKKSATKPKKGARVNA